MKYPSDWKPELSRKPICGVLSVAMIAGVTFARATQAIKNNMMPWQKRHGGKTYHEQRMSALFELDLHPCELSFEGKPVLRKAIEENCLPNRTYMITTSKHVVTVRNNIVADQDEISHIDFHPARRCFVRHIVEIL